MGRRRNRKAPEADQTELLLMGSYADIMTLLLGFFTILYSMSFMDQKKFYEFGKSISSSFRKSQVKEDSSVSEEMMEQRKQVRAFQMLIAIMNIGDEDKAVEKIEKAYSEKIESESSNKALKEGLKTSELNKKDVLLPEEKKGDDNLILDIILPSSTMFVSGSDELTPSAKVKLKELSGIIEKARGGSYLEIIGHTDSIQPGKGGRFSDNWALSSARASAVAGELSQHGVPGQFISTKGKAHYEPLFAEKDKDGRLITENLAKNRRVEIAILRKKR